MCKALHVGNGDLTRSQRIKNNMKTRTNLTLVYNFFFITTVFLFTGCSQEFAFQSSSVVPSAEGSVSVKKGDNNNYNIDLNVKRLAEPDRLSPPMAVYVVWMETTQSGVQNLGQLETSTKGFSKMLSSSLKTVTPYQPTSFFITAEDDALSNYPGQTVVLKTSSFNIK
ncbi:hypothetical protein [Fulvivirga sedimenti]|uniref:Uncharacterized protein n=1 Tax=Fulvivirga sedimenti TaxID=2879465 RepID=A0A9X1HP75_9BACT|nr:hypothetical protein [Fulvivirga sedimenti]MCA6074635.1 hypothetical protein [Fulvivirga sedimenti]MCA6075812.1 hypothetical protein [Fulvivirga sedimenti]MCA6076940.1 hypothetical protein [Fulvivirga sedimenti]